MVMCLPDTAEHGSNNAGAVLLHFRCQSFYDQIREVTNSVSGAMAAGDQLQLSPGPGGSSFLGLDPDKLLETHTVAQAEVVAGQLSR